jgi:hypothetical protein
MLAASVNRQWGVVSEVGRYDFGNLIDPDHLAKKANPSSRALLSDGFVHQDDSRRSTIRPGV